MLGAMLRASHSRPRMGIPLCARIALHPVVRSRRFTGQSSPSENKYFFPFIFTTLVTGGLVSLLQKESSETEQEDDALPDFFDKFLPASSDCEDVGEAVALELNLPRVSRGYTPEPIAPDSSILGKIKHVAFIALRIAQISLLFSPLVLSLPLAYLSSNIGDYWWRYLRFSLENLGGAWIKLGQWASTRPDLFSEEFVRHVTTLQKDSPAHGWDDTLIVLKNSFQQPLNQIFSSFDVQPIASGAIAQVHRAQLKTGQDVAVKVLHPHMADVIESDLSIMRRGADLLSLVPGSKFLDLKDALLQFSDTMRVQTDLNAEGRNLVDFRRSFKHVWEVEFPLYYSSTRQLLIESYEEGEPLTKYLGRPNSDSRRLAKIGLDAYLKMMLVDNFVHADLHPGNIAVRRSPSNDLKLVLYDVGLVTRATPKHFKQFKELFGHIVNGDGIKGAELMVRYSKNGPQVNEKDIQKFSNEMGTLFNHVRESPLSEIKVGDVLYGMLSLVQKYHVVIEEGIGKQLDPEINLMGRAVPFLLMDSDFYEAKELLSDLTPKARAEVTRAVSKEAWNSLKEKVLPT